MDSIKEFARTTGVPFQTIRRNIWLLLDEFERQVKHNEPYD